MDPLVGIFTCHGSKPVSPVSKEVFLGKSLDLIYKLKLLYGDYS